MSGRSNLAKLMASCGYRRLRAVRCLVPRIERPDPIDWPALISDLQAQGASLRQIGRAIDVPHNTVACWKRRRNGDSSIPNHADGEALLALHDLVCRRKDTAAQLAAQLRGTLA